MAVPPKIPSAAPEDKAWYRWITNNVAAHDNNISVLTSRATASNVQHTAVSSNVAAGNAALEVLKPALPQVPTGAPQPPTAPTLSTDHATVTVRWDGQVALGGVVASPPTGFAYTSVQRSSDSVNYVTVGTRMGIAGTVVDTAVTVGATYYYRLVTVDTLGNVSDPSTAVSIIVRGVDLGSLDNDLAALMKNLGSSATTGGLVSYSTTAPTDPAFKVSSSIWFDTSSPSGAVPKRWDSGSSTWVPFPFGTGALGDGSIVASKILAGAIDAASLGAGSVTAQKLGAGSVTAEKIGADAVTANSIAAGSIDANKIAAGTIEGRNLAISAVPVVGTSINRVPQPLTNMAWWASTGLGYWATQAAWTHPNENVTATTTGLRFDAPANGRAIIGVMPVVAVSQSRKFVISFTATAPVIVQYRNITATDQYGWSTATTGTNGTVTVTLPNGTLRYGVYVSVNGGSGGTSVVLQNLTVFEVIGQGGDGQKAELSPAGLKLYNDSGDLSVDLSTSTQNFVSVYNNGQALATIDDGGNGTFQNVMTGEVNVDGDDIAGAYGSWARADGPLDGPLLERLPRGIAYTSYWGLANNLAVSTQYQRLATGVFTPEDGRHYQANINLGGLQVSNTSGVNIYAELQFSTAPFMNVADGQNWARAVIYNGEKGTFALPPVVFWCSSSQGALNPDINAVPLTDIYWQVNLNLIRAPDNAYTLSQFVNAANFTVMDIGRAFVPLDGNDRTSTGASNGNTTTSGKTKITTWAATGSATWYDGGSTRATGGTDKDSAYLYQGLKSTGRGSKVYYPSITSTLSGRTVKKVEVFLQNRWTASSSGGIIDLAGHADTGAGTTYGSDVSGSGFQIKFSRGQGKWVDIPNSEIPYSQWKSGAVKGLSVMRNSTAAKYSYFDGVGKSAPPKLRITYS